jgi:UDPglucose--hexose-1-phosphate uridylyltransferase
MPELRKDPIHGRWVIIATERNARPKDFAVVRAPLSASFCPFCPGNESATAAEVLSFRPNSSAPNTPGWNLRVIPNRFPALRVEGEVEKRGVGLYDTMSGVGAHEVIIETANHAASLASLSVQEVEDLFWAYRLRLQDLRKDERLKAAVIFKNHGAEAGATLEHAHSQLVAMPVVPRTVSEEIEGAERYYKFKDRCVYCDILEQDLRTGERVILESEHAVAIAPFASRGAFEVWLLPRQHSSSFETASKAEYRDMARLLRGVLRKLEKALDDPPYNFVLHTAPFHAAPLPHYHWHIEILPKLSHSAGFEWGSGFTINPTPPEKAAQFLRATEVEG